MIVLEAAVCDKYFELLRIEKNQPDLFYGWILLNLVAQDPGDDARSLMLRISIYTGGNCREGDTGKRQTVCEGECVSVAVGEQFRLASSVSAIDRACRVDDEARREHAAFGNRHFSGWQAIRPLGCTQLHARVQDRGSAAPVNGAIHSTTAKQCAVGSIDDRVNVLRGQVADHKCDASIQ